MEERMGEAFAGTEELTVTGKRLQAGEAAPDFCLNYLGLADLAVRTVGLADSAVMVCLLNVVNSLERPLCQLVTRRWEACCPALPPIAYIYTVSMDSPEMQARWQDSAGVLHQALSAHHSEGINPWLPCKGARHGNRGKAFGSNTNTASSRNSVVPRGLVPWTPWLARGEGMEGGARTA